MSESSKNLDAFDKERLEVLQENADAILEHKEDIEIVLDKTISSDLRFNGFEIPIQRLSFTLYGDVEDSEGVQVAEAIINTVASFKPAVADTLKEECERGDDLMEFFTHLEAKFGIDLDQRINRHFKGNDWWSNVKTDMGYRSGKPNFSHEIVKDYDERIVISSDTQNTLGLGRHMLQQVNLARDTLGEDVLDYLDPDVVDDVAELAQELSEAVEEYTQSVEADSTDTDTEE